MVLNHTVIDTLVSRIVMTVSPEKVLIFGSRARGDALPSSDLDVLVVAESDRPRYERAVPIYRAITDIPIEVDVIVYTPKEIRDWSRVEQAFVTTAMREGRVVYERSR